MVIKYLILILVFITFTWCVENCQKDYKYCGENDQVTCIPSDWWCDGHRDCDSGNDETNCPLTYCQESEIQCKLGTQCIPKFLRCDGITQCLDGSDEEDCSSSSSKICDSLTQFDCNGDGHQCISLNKVCDGHNDCGGNQDEEPGGSQNNCQRNDCKLTLNGGCSHLCSNRFTSIICHCPDGYRLLNDNKTCTNINECSLHPPRCSQICNDTLGGYQCLCNQGYKINPKVPGECIAKDGDRSLLITLDGGEIITSDLNNNINIVHNNSRQSDIWLNIDADVGTSSNTTIYWSTLKNHNVGQTVIKRKPGSSDVFEVIEEKSIYQIRNGSFCAGLSFDWIRSLLFWTSTEEARIYVTNTTSNKTYILKDKLENPRSIVADPFEARLYWIDWGTNDSLPRIETMLMDTRDHRIMVRSGLRQPLGLAIDFLDRRLYWTDINPGSITFIDLNRPLLRKTVITNQLLHPFSLTIFENKVFWSDWRQNQIISVGKTMRNNMNIISKVLKPMSIVVLNRLNRPQIDFSTPQIHTCLNTQPHSCSDICLPSPPTTSNQYATVKCVCTIGTYISSDKHTCTAGPGSLVMPKNINRFRIIVAVLISLVLIIVLSVVIILLYLCRAKACNSRSLKTISRHKIVTGDLIYIFKCHSHSSQLSELLINDYNSVSNA